MFQEITIRNFRTHRDTTVTLGPITLIIGNNNSGKTNLLTALQHFSRLIARGRPASSAPGNAAQSLHRPRQRTVREQPHATAQDTVAADRYRNRYSPRNVSGANFFPYRHRLADREEPMVFKCRWHSPNLGNIRYKMELYPMDAQQSRVGCREHIWLSATDSEEKEFSFGFDEHTDFPGLQTLLTEDYRLTQSDKTLYSRFFRDASLCFTYHFQPTYLRSQGQATDASVEMDDERLVIHSQLGREGGNLHRILSILETRDRRTYDRLIDLLRQFESSFHGILVHPSDSHYPRVDWQFSLTRRGPSRIDQLRSEAVSDGLLRVAAIGLLTSMRSPPAIIQLEEIENGLNPGNIDSVMSLLWEAVAPVESTALAYRGYRNQFILTSHSPSVLRQFADDLIHVYYTRMDKRGHTSDVRNLGETLESYYGLGSIAAEPVEHDGRRSVRMTQSDLTELWYSGAIG